MERLPGHILRRADEQQAAQAPARMQRQIAPRVARRRNQSSVGNQAAAGGLRWPRLQVPVVQSISRRETKQMSADVFIGLFVGASGVALVGIVMMLMRLESKVDEIRAILLEPQADPVIVGTGQLDASIWKD